MGHRDHLHSGQGWERRPTGRPPLSERSFATTPSVKGNRHPRITISQGGSCHQTRSYPVSVYTARLTSHPRLGGAVATQVRVGDPTVPLPRRDWRTGLGGPLVPESAHARGAAVREMIV